jgi:F-type H+-transporting ATPase subunit epsilon
MDESFHIQVATPTGLLVDTDAVSAQIPASTGYIGVLPGHASLLAALGEDKLGYVTTSSETRSLVVHGGYVEIHDDQVRILTPSAEQA